MYCTEEDFFLFFSFLFLSFLLCLHKAKGKRVLAKIDVENVILKGSFYTAATLMQKQHHGTVVKKISRLSLSMHNGIFGRFEAS